MHACMYPYVYIYIMTSRGQQHQRTRITRGTPATGCRHAAGPRHSANLQRPDLTVCHRHQTIIQSKREFQGKGKGTSKIDWAKMMQVDLAPPVLAEEGQTKTGGAPQAAGGARSANPPKSKGKNKSGTSMKGGGKTSPARKGKGKGGGNTQKGKGKGHGKAPVKGKQGPKGTGGKGKR